MAQNLEQSQTCQRRQAMMEELLFLVVALSLLWLLNNSTEMAASQEVQLGL